MTGQVPPAGTERRNRLLGVLRLAVVLAAVAAFVAPLASGVGLAAALAGGLLGVTGGERLARGRLRLGAGVLLGLAVLGLGLAGEWLATGPDLLSRLVGPPAALALGETARWGWATLAVVGTLRLAATRLPALTLLEALLAMSSLALALAAHRHGAFHRPLELGDWAWSRGLDPANVLLALGAAAALALVPLLLRDTVHRVGRQLLTLALLALAVLLFVDVVGPPRPEQSGGPGLEGKGEQGGQGGSGGAAGAQARRAGARAGAQGGQRGAGDGGGGQAGRAGLTGPGAGQGQGQSQGQGSGPGGPGRPATDEQFPFRDDSSGGGESAVAVVVFHDDYTPPQGYYYFRQVAFSQFNGRRLVRSTRADVDQDLLGAFPSRRVQLPQGPGTGPTNPADRVRSTMALLSDHRQPFGLVSPLELTPLPNPDRARFVRLYEVVSRVERQDYEALLSAAAGDPAWSTEVRASYLALPADPRYRALADELLAVLAPAWRDRPLARALAVKRWMDTNVVYSLRSQHSAADDPVADFLFGDRIGYCIHIAHAAVYLLRALGVPARVGAGYAVEAAHQAGGASLLVRSGNAHTWPEIFLQGHGWVVVDPTPERSEEQALAPPDPVLQRMLGEMARGDERAAGAPPPADDPDDEQWSLGFDPRQLLLIFPPLALALLLALYGVKLWRRLAPRLAGERELTRLAYRAAADRLAELGWRRDFGETRPRFARRAARQAPSFEPLTEQCLAASLGSRRARPPAAATRALLQAQADELTRTVPRWRRWFGAADPTSWLRTR